MGTKKKISLFEDGAEETPKPKKPEIEKKDIVDRILDRALVARTDWSKDMEAHGVERKVTAMLDASLEKVIHSVLGVDTTWSRTEVKRDGFFFNAIRDRIEIIASAWLAKNFDAAAVDDALKRVKFVSVMEKVAIDQLEWKLKDFVRERVEARAREILDSAMKDVTDRVLFETSATFAQLELEGKKLDLKSKA